MVDAGVLNLRGAKEAGRLEDTDSRQMNIENPEMRKSQQDHPI